MDVQTAEQLVKNECLPCEGGIAAMTGEQSNLQLRSLTDWSLATDGKSILRKFALRDFKRAMALLNAVAELAEKEQHHPDLHLTGYRNVRIELTTHAIGGLSQNDFILAAKIDLAARAVSS